MAKAQVPGFGHSVQINAVNLNFREAMTKFQDALGSPIYYDNAIIPEGKRFNLYYVNISGKQALEDFLNSNGLDYLIMGNKIVLKKLNAKKQKNVFRLSGRITARENAEYLSNAEIRNLNNGQIVYSSGSGYFSLSLEADSNRLQISYPGFELIADTLKGDRNYFVNYSLVQKRFDIETVVISPDGRYENSSVKKGESDQYRITGEKMKWTPNLLGEPDILRVMSLYPGVVNGSEGMLGMYVRGGALDQNLVLLDDVPIFNSYHLYGIFSVFNSDIIKSAELLKGSFPARYGGRLSSVINVQSKEGNAYDLKGSVSLGLLTSRLFLEGPILKNRMTYVFSVRRSYLDFLTQKASELIFLNDSIKNNIYYFWDVNARVTHRFSNRSRLTLSFYKGADRAGLVENSSSDDAVERIVEKRSQVSNWGNTVYSVKWNYFLKNNIGMTVKAHVTDYRYFFKQNYTYQKNVFNSPDDINDFTEYKLTNGLRDYEAGVHWDKTLPRDGSLLWGMGYVYHRFIPGNRHLKSNIDSAETIVNYNDKSVSTPELFMYGEHNSKLGKRIYYSLGMRNSIYLIDEQKAYILPEWRFSSRFKLREDKWFHASATRNYQFFHLLNNLTLGLPSDIWVPSNERFRPGRSDQFSLGFSLDKKMFQASTEVFYKAVTNILEYKNNAGYITSAENWEDAVTAGRGYAYGWELLLEKTTGRFMGWISYALLWNKRKFPELNDGNVFPARYDRRHNLYLNAIYRLSKSTDISASWIYNTGFAFTLPTSIYTSPTPTGPDRDILVYGDRNNTRTAPNHRLDLAVNFKKQHLHYKRIWSLGVFNAYNRHNPFYFYFAQNKSGKRALYQVSLLPLIPNLSYKIEF